MVSPTNRSVGAGRNNDQGGFSWNDDCLSMLLDPGAAALGAVEFVVQDTWVYRVVHLHYLLPKYRLASWEKYDYVLSAALTASVAS
jgi:hypothetical protein